MLKLQSADEVVDIADWQIDPEFGVYPEGSRPKTAHLSPVDSPFTFIVPNHRYLFKLSVERYPAQFWAEIIAYRVGLLMKVTVPPAFVAVNSFNGKVGALIEWFYGYSADCVESYVAGGEFMQRRIPGFDRVRGTQHNFLEIVSLANIMTRAKILDKNWLEHWAKTLLFDALIGNTDRHQENWGLIYATDLPLPKVRFSPAFDNGTSMGHEIIETKLHNFTDQTKIEKYIGKGTHHMKWDVSDPKGAQHIELLLKIADKFPSLKAVMLNSLNFDLNKLHEIMDELVKVDCPVSLSQARATFITDLITKRHGHILSRLGEL